MSDPVNINFWSQKNYMKRSSSSGAISLGAPTTPIFGGFQYVTQSTIFHNLGIVPFFTLFYEPFGDGVVWEAMGTRVQAEVVNPRSTSTTGPYLLGWATSTTLVIEIGYISNLLVGPFNVDYVLYRDYGIA